MRILVVGAGGVGAAAAAIARRRDFFEHLVLADLDADRAAAAVGRPRRRPRPPARRSTRRTAPRSSALARAERADTILNACDPRLNPPIFDAALEAGCTYLDMAMTLSRPHPERPYEETGVLLGDEQFAGRGRVGGGGAARAGGHRRRARAVRRLRPLRGRPPVLARSTRSACATAPTWPSTATTFAPTFSIWTTIEECLNPPLIWERERGFFTTEPFSRARDVRVPRGHRPGRVRQRRARGGRAHPALGRLRARDVQVRPRRGVHRRAADAATCSASTRPSRSTCAARRSRRATSSPPRCPTRPRSATA